MNLVIFLKNYVFSIIITIIIIITLKRTFYCSILIFLDKLLFWQVLMTFDFCVFYKLYYYFILPSTTLKGMLLTGMCQAESPQTEVRRSVRDAAQAVLYSVDGLMEEDISKIKLWKRGNFVRLIGKVVYSHQTMHGISFKLGVRNMNKILYHNMSNFI